METMLYAPVEWHDCSGGYTDIRYEKSTDGIAKITINRPQVLKCISSVDRQRDDSGAGGCPLRRRRGRDYSDRRRR